MTGIQFRHLSMEEAETCIAEIWTCLEEYRFTSPTMSFSWLNGSTVSFTIELDDPIAESMVMTRLANLAGGGESVVSPASKQGASHLRFISCR